VKNKEKQVKAITVIPGYLSLEEAGRELVRYAELIRDSSKENVILEDPALARQVLEIRRRGLKAILDLIEKYTNQPFETAKKLL
jgi:predicted metal-dependent TIM-barrel fold hydrolase